MGHRCCGKHKVKRGLWSPEEDEKLLRYITTHGHPSWSSVPKLAGLQRCGKSCRLRWINYLRPDLKRGSFNAEEEQIIIDAHRILGNKWAQIAKHLPGRTDNEVKNFWNSCIKKKLLSQGLDPTTHNLMPSHRRSSFNNHNHTKLKPGNRASESATTFSITNVNPHSSTKPNPNRPSLPLNSPNRTLFSQPMLINDPYNATINDATINDAMSGLVDTENVGNCSAWSEVDGMLLSTHTPQIHSELSQKEQSIRGHHMDILFDTPSTSFDPDIASIFSSAMSVDFNPMDDLEWPF